MSVLQTIGRAVNVVVRPLVASPRWGRLVGNQMALVTYTGRRSGQTFSIPVGYRRDGDRLTIGVQFPDRKSWWRNFTGTGGPITVRLHGTDRTGHAVAVRDADGVRVDVDLTPAR